MNHVSSLNEASSREPRHLLRYVQKCTQQQKWQKREHIGEFGKYGENDNFATITNRAKHKAMRGPIKVGDTGKFGKYGKNDNFATFADKAKHKAMRGPIKVAILANLAKMARMTILPQSPTGQCTKQ